MPKPNRQMNRPARLPEALSGDLKDHALEGMDNEGTSRRIMFSSRMMKTMWLCN